jgi:hypothetical protein
MGGLGFWLLFVGFAFLAVATMIDGLEPQKKLSSLAALTQSASDYFQSNRLRELVL